MENDLIKGHKEISDLISFLLKEDFSNFEKNKELSKYGTYILKKRNAENVFNFMINAFHKNEIKKAIKHAHKLSRMTKTYANDFPFEIGEKVAIIRYRHGWMNGNLVGFVKSRNLCSGIWNYDIETEDYGTIFLEHTRDAFRC